MHWKTTFSFILSWQVSFSDRVNVCVHACMSRMGIADGRLGCLYRIECINVHVFVYVFHECYGCMYLSRCVCMCVCLTRNVYNHINSCTHVCMYVYIDIAFVVNIGVCEWEMSTYNGVIIVCIKWTNERSRSNEQTNQSANQQAQSYNSTHTQSHTRTHIYIYIYRRIYMHACTHSHTHIHRTLK